MSKIRHVKGENQWRTLIGKDISFDWSDGWDDYDPRGVVESIRLDYGNDPRYPRVYVEFEEGGAYAVRDSETVAVTVHN